MAEKDVQQEQSGLAKMDVKSEVAQRLIEAMERGDTPWQKPWKANAMRPMNAATQNSYKGVNRLLLALAGRSSNVWMTYKQASEKGWQVKKGEKGTMIVKVVEFDRDRAGGGNPAGPAHAGGSESKGVGHEQDANQQKSAALRRYWVFNADQIDGMPASEEQAKEPFEPIARAEAVMEALKQRTGLMVIHGGAVACYSNEHDQISLPPKNTFADPYAYYSTALHEAAHSTLNKKRMDRVEAIGKKWGDEAYAMEELRAQICSALVYSELAVGDAGMAMGQTQAHIDNHAAYLKGWIKAIANDPMAIFSAAKDAEKMSEYMLGLEREYTAADKCKEWVADYDQGYEAAQEAQMERRR